jgi:hypothetical protein
MTTRNALDLVEIRLHLAKFLSKQTLTVCARVSTEWRNSFQPSIWQDINIQLSNAASPVLSTANDKDTTTKTASATIPPLEKLIENANCIERLVCGVRTVPLVLRDQLTCRSLKSLDLSAVIMQRSQTHAKPKQGVPITANDVAVVTLFEETMIQRHRDTLQELKLNFLPWWGTGIWDTIGSCTRLRSLTVKNAVISSSDLTKIWKVWSSLKKLELSAYFHTIEDEVNRSSCKN